MEIIRCDWRGEWRGVDQDYRQFMTFQCESLSFTGDLYSVDRK
ncbi:hypothetical protein BURPS668_A0221 [Burkholderia pseudomallei 668]|nr:hypothetical protein BURPS668_A0221 [Burkholderia pseudomallei 668]